MSLDDKVIIPAAPVEPTQKSELPAKAGRKRRRNEGAGATSRRSKRLDDDDDWVEVSAVLTLSSDDGPRRAPKKMLFEPDDDGAAAMPAAPEDQNGSTRAGLSMTTAAVLETLPPQIAAAPAATLPPPKLPMAPALGNSQSREPQEHPIGIEDSATWMATWAMREPEPARLSPPNAIDPGADVAPMRGAAEVDSDPPPSATADAYDSVTPAVSDTAIDDVDAAAADVGDRAATTEMPAAPRTDSPEDASPAPSWPEPMAAMSTETPPAVVDTMATTGEPAPAPMATQLKAPEPKAQTETPSRDRGAAGLSRSEAIARAARMSALSGSRATGAIASPAATRSLPPSPQRRAELPKHPGDLFGYWTRMKNGRRFPSRADFDVEQVAENLPNSMLLTCGGIGGGQVSFSSVLRLGGNRRSRPGQDLTFTSMITEWILTIGGEAARAGTPVQDTEVFPSTDGTFAYKIVALPLSDQQSRVDHVLCHLSRS